jgi:hypothetical protein
MRPIRGLHWSRWVPASRREELRVILTRSHQVAIFAAVTGAVTGALVAGFEWIVVELLFDRVVQLERWQV